MDMLTTIFDLSILLSACFSLRKNDLSLFLYEFVRSFNETQRVENLTIADYCFIFIEDFIPTVFHLNC